jgi:putative ABC transport system substrate-binding protein
MSLAANPNFEAFRAALNERGLVEGRNLVIVYRSAEGREERFRGLAAELAGLKVDIILARSTPAILAAKNLQPNLPVVMAAIADPYRVVKSIARPGENVTGLTSLLTDIYPKRVELLKELLPGLKRIAFVTNLSTVFNTRTSEEIGRAAKALGLQADFLNQSKPEDSPGVFAEGKRRGVDAFIMGTGAVSQANQHAIVKLAVEHRIPVIYGAREFVEAGGLEARRSADRAADPIRTGV